MAEPYYQHAGITIYHGDCREILPSLTADAVVTDPPYGIGAHKMPQGFDRTPRTGHAAWDAERPHPETFALLLAAAPHAVIWGGQYFADMLPARSGWLAWDKCQEFSGADFELAWTTRGGASRAYRKTRVEAHAGPDSVRGHPTPKPLGLMRWCIERLPDTCHTILDPFMGSGTTLRAAKDLGRKAIGIEIEERYCEIAARRLGQEVLPFGDTP